jgi:hypothetical protein
MRAKITRAILNEKQGYKISTVSGGGTPGKVEIE